MVVFIQNSPREQDDDGWVTLPVVPGTDPTCFRLAVEHIRFDFSFPVGGADLLAAYEGPRRPPEPPA